MPNRELHIQMPGALWPPTWPMGLTMLRLLLLPGFLWALLAYGRGSPAPATWIPIAIYAVMAITDKLDGYLARRLNQTTRLGTILDPVADKLLVGCSVILLSLQNVSPQPFTVPDWVVVAVYGKDLVVVCGTIALLAVTGKVTIRPRLLGKFSTLLQLCMVMAVLLAPGTNTGPSNDWLQGWLTFVRILWWTVTALAVAAAIDYVLEGFRQFFAWRRARASGVPALNETSGKPDR